MCDIPEGLQYTRNDEWVVSDGDFAVVGVALPRLATLGAVEAVGLPAVDQAIRFSRPIGYLYANHSRFPICAPLQGTVTSINAKVLGNPAIINEDPYRAGWLFRMRIDPGQSKEHLLDAGAYRRTLSNVDS